MSADKRKSLRRRVNLLARMELGGGRAAIHCEGGRELADPTIQRLLADGHVRFARYAYSKVWAHDLNRPADLRRSVIVTTDKGRAFLNANRHLVETLNQELGLISYPKIRQDGRILDNNHVNYLTLNWAAFQTGSNDPRYPYRPSPLVRDRWGWH